MIKKNIKNSRDLEVDNIIVNGSISGSFNLSPENIMSQPPNQVTVDKYSKLISVVGGILDTNSTQTVNSTKTFNNPIKLNATTNATIQLRNEFSDNFLVHGLQYIYDPSGNSYDVLIASSDESNVDVGLNVGYHLSNLLANPTTSKFNIRYRNTTNSTKMNIEDVNFLKMNNTVDNRFQLTSLDCISIGSTLTNQASIYVKKTGNAEIKLESVNSISKLDINGGAESRIQVGPSYAISNTALQPDILYFFRDPITPFMNYNIASSCLSIGDNNASAGQSYNILNLAAANKSLKMPYMTTSQENSFIAGLAGNTYSGSLYFQRDSNRLSFVDHNNIIHRISGTSALGGLEVNNIANNSIIGFIKVSDISNTNNITELPESGNIKLENLVGVTTNVQTQLNTKVDISTDQTIMSVKTFSQSVNNSNNIKIDNPIGSINGLEITNAFSPNNLRILKNQDDLTFVLGSVERARLSENDFNLSNGGEFLNNGVAIKSKTETLTNKTFSFANNTPIDFMSTNTDQTLSSRKTFTNTEPIVFANITESKLSYSGITNYSMKMATDGFNFYNETTANSLFKIENSSLKYKDNIINTAKINSSSSAPSTTNDNTQGYSINSIWFNTANKSRYLCDDNTSNSAVWRNTNSRSLSFSPFTTTTTNTLDSFLYFTADDYYYNKLRIIYSIDGTAEFQLYNLSLSTIITTSSVVSAGIDILNMNLTGAPLKIARDQTLRLSIKMLSGTFASCLSVSSE